MDGIILFRNALLRLFLKIDIKKQDDMRHEYQTKSLVEVQKIKFYIGDIREYKRADDTLDIVDYIFISLKD